MTATLQEPMTAETPASVAKAADEKQTSQPPCSIIRTEMRVLLGVVCVVLLLELTFRVAGDNLSKDISHLRSFPTLSRELAALPESQGLKVLFLGNSLTRYGVDPARFTQVCKQEFGEKIQAVKMNPDNTALADWFYGYRTYFSRTGNLPDALIIGFEGGHLRDAPSKHPDRLAQYYCTAEDYADLCHYDLHNFEEKASYFLSRISAVYGNRDRLQRRVLDWLIPDYRAGMDELNLKLNQQQQAARPATTPDYSRLLELVAQAERDNVQVILVAMPVPQDYALDDGLLEVVHSTSAQLIDCRQVPGITPPMFFDGLHMDEQAQELYSQNLAEQCGPLLKSLAEKETSSATSLVRKH